jgi:hypothetical protein
VLLPAAAGALLVGALAAGEARAATRVITGDYRLIDRFAQDGTIVTEAWFEAQARYAEWDGGRDLEAAILLAFRLGRDAEAGVVLGAIERRRDPGAELLGSEVTEPIEGAGWSDLKVYGKYRFLRSPIELSIGAAAVLPLADEDRGLGAGVVEHEVFVGARQAFGRASLVGSLGVSGRGRSRGPGGADGRSAAVAGIGVLVPLVYEWTLLAEVDYEGRRFEGGAPDARLLLGLDWRPTQNTVLRGALARGLDDGAPDLQAVLSGAFHF